MKITKFIYFSFFYGINVHFSHSCSGVLYCSACFCGCSDAKAQKALIYFLPHLIVLLLVSLLTGGGMREALAVWASVPRSTARCTSFQRLYTGQDEFQLIASNLAIITFFYFGHVFTLQIIGLDVEEFWFGELIVPDYFGMPLLIIWAFYLIIISLVWVIIVISSSSKLEQMPSMATLLFVRPLDAQLNAIIGNSREVVTPVVMCSELSIGTNHIKTHINQYEYTSIICTHMLKYCTVAYCFMLKYRT